ncbi:MAG: hypothetical protein MJ231_08835 [bacterium]|nr:hypothetical protein [bacterium]
MNYIYFFAGLILGIIFIGIGKNTHNRKTIPYEVTKKLKGSKKMDEYNEWCDTEAKADTIIGTAFLVFGISSTFMDSVVWLGNIISIISLILFVTGYFIKVTNNKKRLGHFFVK